VLSYISSRKPAERRGLLKCLVQGLPTKTRAEILVAIVAGTWPELSVGDFHLATHNFLGDVGFATNKLPEINADLAAELAACDDGTLHLENLIERVYRGDLPVTTEAGAILAGSQSTAALLIAAAAGHLPEATAILLFRHMAKSQREAFLNTYPHIITRAVQSSTAIATLWGSCSNPGAGFGINLDLLCDAYDRQHPGLATLIRYSATDDLVGLLRSRPDAGRATAQAILELEDVRSRELIIQDIFEQFAEARELFDVGRDLLEGLLNVPGLVTLILEGHSYGRHALELVTLRLTGVFQDELALWQRFYALVGSWAGSLDELTQAVLLLDEQAA
jgi:hypothetical protein